MLLENEDQVRKGWRKGRKGRKKGRNSMHMFKRKSVSGREENIQSVMRSSHRFTIGSLSESTTSYLFSFSLLSPSLSAPLAPRLRGYRTCSPFSSFFSSLFHLFTWYIKRPNLHRARDSAKSATRLDISGFRSSPCVSLLPYFSS